MRKNVCFSFFPFLGNGELEGMGTRRLFFRTTIIVTIDLVLVRFLYNRWEVTKMKTKVFRLNVTSSPTHIERREKRRKRETEISPLAKLYRTQKREETRRRGGEENDALCDCQNDHISKLSFFYLILLQEATSSGKPGRR